MAQNSEDIRRRMSTVRAEYDQESRKVTDLEGDDRQIRNEIDQRRRHLQNLEQNISGFQHDFDRAQHDEMIKQQQAMQRAAV